MSYILSGILGIMVGIFFAKWTNEKADRKYDRLEHPIKHCLEGLKWLMVPLIPVCLVWGIICALVFGG